MLAKDQRSSLFCRIISKGKKGFMEYREVVTIKIFLSKFEDFLKCRQMVNLRQNLKTFFYK
jgi:hypothetical protein